MDQPLDGAAWGLGGALLSVGLGLRPAGKETFLRNCDQQNLEALKDEWVETAKNFTCFPFRYYFLKAPSPGLMPEVEEAPAPSAGPTSGPGCMLQEGPSYGDDTGRRPTLVDGREKKRKGKSQEAEGKK